MQDELQKAYQQRLAIGKVYADVLELPYVELNAGKILAIIEGRLMGIDATIKALENASNKKIRDPRPAQSTVHS